MLRNSRKTVFGTFSWFLSDLNQLRWYDDFTVLAAHTIQIGIMYFPIKRRFQIFVV